MPFRSLGGGGGGWALWSLLEASMESLVAVPELPGAVLGSPVAVREVVGAIWESPGAFHGSLGAVAGCTEGGSGQWVSNTAA